MKHAENAEIGMAVDSMSVIVDEFSILVDYGFEEYSAEFEVPIIVHHFREWSSVRPVYPLLNFIYLPALDENEQY